MKTYKALLPYILQNRKVMALAVFFLLAQTASEAAVPYVMAKMIDEGFTSGRLDTLIRYGVVMVFLAVCIAVFGYLAIRYHSAFSARTVSGLRSDFIKKICSFSAADMQGLSEASMMTRMIEDVNQIQQALQMLSTFFSAPCYIILAIVMSFQINGRLSLIFLAVVPVFSLFIMWIVKRSRPFFEKKAKSADHMNRYILENLTNMRLVKAFVREKHQEQGFAHQADGLRGQKTKAELMTNISNPLLQFSVNLCICLLLWFGGKGIVAGAMQVGELFGLITYTNQILYQVILISMVLVPILNIRVSIERAAELLRKESLAQEREDAELVAEGGGDLTFRDVLFDYREDLAAREDPLLHNLSFHIQQGECVGVYGATGQGKTTLISLLTRMYDAKGGEILISGKNIRDMKLSSLRKHFAYAPQKSRLFAGSIRDNLKYGHEGASDEEMIQAAKIAEIHTFIESLPLGYDTLLQEGGGNVSGGQRQRLCIARALLSPANILVFDDSTSGLDRVSEQKVIQRLCQDCPGRTRLIITGKVSNLMQMDRILVLDGGTLAGFGTHQELYASCQIYHDLCESQNEVAV